MDDFIKERLEKEDKKIASVKRRFLAYFIDYVICFILIFVIYSNLISEDTINKLRLAIQEQDIELFNSILIPYINFLLITRFSYLLLFFYLYGATLGNIITKTKIISYENFDSPNFLASLYRAIVFMICDIFLNGVLFLSIFLNKTNRNFADVASKSVVIEVD